MLVMGTLKRDPPLIIWKPPFVVAHQADCKLDVCEFLLAPSRARCDKPREAQFLGPGDTGTYWGNGGVIQG